MSQVNQIALVTGVSSGIGQATAAALLSRGFTVYGTSRKSQSGTVIGGINMLNLDVTDDQSVNFAVTEILRLSGRIDVLVNNAGFGVLGGAEESSVDQAKALFDTNLFGVIRMTNAVLPRMRQQKSGRIVNISSVLGFIPSPYMALYTASKHALEGYSESLDHEVRTFGIKVALIQPAYTKTAFDQNMVPVDGKMSEYHEMRIAIESTAAEVVATGDDPQIVAAVVLRAIFDRKPKIRYPAGSLAKRLTLLRRFVPALAFDRSLRKQMKLDA